jgi:FdhD protein
MVRKAKISKLPLVASISAATEQGALLAERSNITLVGFVREGRMNIYSHPERIV